MKKIIGVLILVTILTIGCSKNHKLSNENMQTTDLKATLLDDVYSEKPNNKIEYTYKYEYLKKLDDLDEDVKKSTTLLEEESTLKMLETEEEHFNIWNNELNNIYKVIKEQLSEKDYKKFKKQEITWLNKREKLANKEAEEFEDMDFSQVEYNSSLAKLTKERCYELVNKYLQ